MLMQMAGTSFFFVAEFWSTVYMPRFPYPFIHQWKLRLFLCLGYCEQCCSEHGVHISLGDPVFVSFEYMLGVDFLGHMIVLFLIS